MSNFELQDEHPRKRMKLESSEVNVTPINPSLNSSNGTQGGIQVKRNDAELDVEKEARAGITEYIVPGNLGFTGILKQRYTDFLVNEILPSGKVLHLENLDVPQHKRGVDADIKAEPSSAGDVKPEATATTAEQARLSENTNIPSEKLAEQANGDAEKEKKVPQIPEEDVQELQSIFGGDTTSAILSLHAAVHKHPERKAREFKAVTTGVIADKQQRTNAHQILRRVFPSRFESSTEKDETMTIRPLPPRERGKRGNRNEDNRGHGRGKVPWEELGGEYLYFTLFKENKDTMELISYLGSQLRLGPKTFAFAGTKDRRGVTVQRVSAKRVNASQLIGVGKRLFNAEIGDFDYQPNGLRLGDLMGNEFVITLRDCHFEGEESIDPAERPKLANEVLTKAVRDFQEKGFINYYGLQRFGSFAASTDKVGVKILQDDLKSAVDDLLYFSPEVLVAAQDPGSTVLISSDDKARAEAINIWKTTGNSGEALRRLPRKFSAENCLIRHLGSKNREGDYQGAISQIPRNLRLMYVHAYQSLVWNTVAGKRWSKFGPEVVEGDLVLVHEHKDKDGDQIALDEVDQNGEVIVRPTGENSATLASDVFERARPLSKAEVESGDYSIFDVVLPLPGFDVEYPMNEIGEFYKTFMKSDKGGGLDPYNMRRSWKDMSLSGSYRKIMARPLAEMEFEVREYVKDDEQFVETDLERIRKTDKKADRESKRKAEADRKEEETTGVNDNLGAEVAKKLAVVLKLQLGTSQYATMALRELMKAGGVKTYRPEYGTGR